MNRLPGGDAPDGARGASSGDEPRTWTLPPHSCKPDEKRRQTLTGARESLLVTTLVVVPERTQEIGPRRVPGARGRHITGRFLTGSVVLGAPGGLAGTSLGALTVPGVAVVRDRTPVLHPAVAVGALVIGLGTGPLAGPYPARRAGRVQPVEALRR